MKLKSTLTARDNMKRIEIVVTTGPHRGGYTRYEQEQIHTEAVDDAHRVLRGTHGVRNISIRP